jgi:6-phosphogluconate dehydrogenase
MMPGGQRGAVKALLPLLQAMAADDGIGGKCVASVGPGGSGHFVKTVHNGIEYALMQLIAESYDVLRTIGGFDAAQLADTFEAWSALPELGSFLTEITGKMFRTTDDATGKLLLDLIQDKGGQKGTGKWTVDAAMEYGVPVPAIVASVESRTLSGSTELRSDGKEYPHVMDLHDPLPRPLKLRSLVAAALETSTLLAYQQGFSLLKVASDAEQWKLDLSEIARIWRGGCIIRSRALAMFQGMHGEDAEAHREAFLHRLSGERQLDLRRIVGIGVSRGVPLPAMSASLTYLDAVHRAWLPQNLVVAQRDYFGHHGFERTDRSGVFHGDWQQ